MKQNSKQTILYDIIIYKKLRYNGKKITTIIEYRVLYDNNDMGLQK